MRLYENLVDEEKGVYNKEDGSLNLNPNSLIVRKDCYVEDSFDGSLPAFIAAFTKGKPLTEEETEEIRRIIDGRREV